MKRTTSILVMAWALLLAGAAQANGQEVCPGDHLDPPLVDLGDGTYCVKYATNVTIGSFEEVSAALEDSKHDLSHWSFDPADEPTKTPVPGPTATDVPPTDVPSPTSSAEPSATPTEVEPTETSTEEPTVTPTQVEPTPEVCKWVPVGELFHLYGPDGESAWFASFSPHPDPDRDYYLPGAEYQEQCLGWVAVNAPESRIIYRNTCTGEYSETLVRCMGGGLCGVYDE